MKYVLIIALVLVTAPEIALAADPPWKYGYKVELVKPYQKQFEKKVAGGPPSANPPLPYQLCAENPFQTKCIAMEVTDPRTGKDLTVTYLDKTDFLEMITYAAEKAYSGNIPNAPYKGDYVTIVFGGQPNYWTGNAVQIKAFFTKYKSSGYANYTHYSYYELGSGDLKSVIIQDATQAAYNVASKTDYNPNGSKNNQVIFLKYKNSGNSFQNITINFNDGNKQYKKVQQYKSNGYVDKQAEVYYYTAIDDNGNEIDKKSVKTIYFFKDGKKPLPGGGAWDSGPSWDALPKDKKVIVSYSNGFPEGYVVEITGQSSSSTYCYESPAAKAYCKQYDEMLELGWSE